MPTNNSLPKNQLWAARIMSWIVILFMLMDGIFKLIQPEEVVKATLELGFAEHHITVIGILALLCALLYAYPRTSLLGAILLTGFWGGAIATHFSLDNPLFTHILFPVYLAVLAWGAIWQQNEQLRNFFPFLKRSDS